MCIKITLISYREVHRNDSSATINLFDYPTYVQNAPLKSF